MPTIDTSRISTRRVVASVSGGKDSAAMCLALMDAGIDHERVFLDTGWEHPATYEYLRGPLTAKLGPITELRGDLLMPDLIRKKMMFPSRMRRYCTQLLKVKPMQRYIAARPDDVINCVGIRRAESRARSQMTEWEWSEGFDCEVWRPILMWTEQDVIDIHTRHGLQPNPLYLHGAKRVGCWPCIMSSKSEIRLVADMDPGRIDAIRSLEAEVSEGAMARAAAKGVGLDNPPAFFQAMGSMRSESVVVPCPHCPGLGSDCDHCDGDGVIVKQGNGRTVPIDDVVAWSRTERGGRQMGLFEPTERDEGCVRWGLCDTSIDLETT